MEGKFTEVPNGAVDELVSTSYVLRRLVLLATYVTAMVSSSTAVTAVDLGWVVNSLIVVVTILSSGIQPGMS